jgi:hypothetical protein
MSTMQSPPPDAPVPAGPPERRCPRCGSAMAPDQEWCLACGAAAVTEVVEARGWRVPLYLGGGLVALAILGVIIAIVALSDGKEQVAGTPTPGPQASVPPGQTVSPIPTTSAIPTVTAAPTTDPNSTPDATISPVPTETATPDSTVDSGGSGSFPGWTGADGDYTIIIESADSQAAAEKVATKAQDEDGLTVGILESSQYSSLNGGYYVVFTGDYSSKSDAQAELDGVRDSFPDAYVRQIKT